MLSLKINQAFEDDLDGAILWINHDTTKPPPLKGSFLPSTTRVTPLEQEAWAGSVSDS